MSAGSRRRLWSVSRQRGRVELHAFPRGGSSSAVEETPGSNQPQEHPVKKPGAANQQQPRPEERPAVVKFLPHEDKDAALQNVEEPEEGPHGREGGDMVHQDRRSERHPSCDELGPYGLRLPSHFILPGVTLTVGFHKEAA